MIYSSSKGEKMLKEINLKEVGSVDSCIAITQMEIEKGKKEGVSVIKLIHGYGSHGQGGIILKEVRRELAIMKRQKKIRNYFNGDKWNLFENEVIEILNKDKTIVGDSDINRRNPGITIVII